MSTLKQFRASAANALEEYIAIFSERTGEDGRVREVSNDEMIKIYSHLIGYRPNDPAPYYGQRHTIIGILPDFITQDNNVPEIKRVLEWIEANPMTFRIWVSYYNALERNYGNIYNVSMRWNKFITSNEDVSMDNTGQMTGYSYYKFLFALMSVQIEKQDLIKGRQDANRIVNSYKDTVRRYEPATNKDTGIAKLFKEAPAVSGTLINSQLRKAIKDLEGVNGLTARTWGFEIEVPDACGVEPVYNSGIEKGEDGSLRSYNSNNCDCDCSSCVYHECNCDHCEDGNDSPEHDCGYSECSQADMAEFRTTGAIQRLKHSGMYDLLKKLNNADAEMNDTAGTHIHVWAQDLTTNQVGQVMAIYKYTESIMSVIAGRFNVNYAGEMQSGDIALALSRKNPQLKAIKPRAVNVTHLLGGRGTLEFRQMDCNLNADRITFWAWLVRGLVEVVKRGATLREFMKVKDLDDIIKVYAVWNFELTNENPGEVIPGSRVDQNLVKTVQHKQFSN